MPGDKVYENEVKQYKDFLFEKHSLEEWSNFIISLFPSKYRIYLNLHRQQFENILKNFTMTSRDELDRWNIILRDELYDQYFNYDHVLPGFFESVNNFININIDVQNSYDPLYRALVFYLLNERDNTEEQYNQELKEIEKLPVKYELDMKKYKEILDKLNYVYIMIGIFENGNDDYIIIPKDKVKDMTRKVEIIKWTLIDPIKIISQYQYKFGANLLNVYKELGYRLPNNFICNQKEKNIVNYRGSDEELIENFTSHYLTN